MSESESKEEKEGKKPLKYRFKSICVFGESYVGKNGEFLVEASNLGHALADRKINIVYGGGLNNLKGSTTISANIKGSKVLSVLVNGLDDKKITIGKQVKVSSLPERMGCMFYSAEAFIALPGGFETLEAISSIAYWASLNFHQKPIGLLNVNGCYNGLLSFLDQAVEKGFITQATRRAIMSASTADQLIDQLQDYAPEPDPSVKKIDWQSPDISMKQEPDTTLRL